MPDTVTCAECKELRRSYITVSNEARSLASRIQSRHASAPERRRLHRLKTDAHVARELLVNHQATCPEVL